MKKIIMNGPGKSRIAEVEIPKISDGELLVKLTYTGMCHSEWYPWYSAKPGDLLGHEPIGVVEEVGKNVTGFKKGDRVSGLATGYAEYSAFDARYTVHVPDGVSDEDGVAEPLSCLLSVASKMPVEVPGDSVAVVGAGYMGLGMISLFRLKGAGRIVAIDPREEARENAMKFGATEVYSPDALPEGFRVGWGLIDSGGDIFENGFRTVMEFTGAEEGLRLAGELTCAHGRLGIGGYHNDAYRSLDMKLWNYKAITAISTHERRRDFQTRCCAQALDMLDRGLWNFKGLVHNVYNMEDFDRANREMNDKPRGYVKALVRC